MPDRCFGGSLTSAERLYLDRLWVSLGVPPENQIAEAIEGRLILAAVRDLKDRITEMQREAL